jgi:serine/threonine protein kinase
MVCWVSFLPSFFLCVDKIRYLQLPYSLLYFLTCVCCICAWCNFVERDCCVAFLFFSTCFASYYHFLIYYFFRFSFIFIDVFVRSFHFFHFLYRCIFAELKQRSALFCAGTEVEIVELIFRLLGTPQGTLLNTYKHYPDWEKINFNKTYTSRLQSEYSRHFDTYGLQLLDRLLDINPQTRVTAKDALDHRYFAPDTVVHPSL